MSALRRSCLLAAALLLSACGPTVDLSQGLQVTILDSGWYDAGIVNGQNKLVPSVTFKVKNVSSQMLTSLQVNSLFRRVTEKDEWGDAFVTVAGSNGLAPNAESAALTLRSQRGYTGSDQSRQEMLANSHFVDAKVELLAKYGSAQWKRLGEYPIQRKLIDKQPEK
ncbi:MAG TPA: hypothetical protein VFB07_00345 [Vicinamibacterales bacterium]|nr:hypothetical protein [Vicinamibacterales bacterium]